MVPATLAALGAPTGLPKSSWSAAVAIAEGHESAWAGIPAPKNPRAASRRRRWPDGPGADVRNRLRDLGHGNVVLLTHADLADRERYLNARSALLTLLLRWAWCR